MTPLLAEMPTSREKMENQRQIYVKIFRRIGKFKKYIHDVCTVISNHAVKVAVLRDKNDEVAKCLDDFTKIEEFSTTSKLSMAVVAELMATVGDHQDLAVQRVETLVLPNLSSYARICDCIKADVWNAMQAIRREKRKRKCFITLKRKADDSKTKSSLNDAQRELERASAETARFCELCEEQVLKFEHKRLIDLKETLGTFIKVQIATHAKSLELLSETYRQIQSIDEDGDLEILKSCLKIGSIGTHKLKKKSSATLVKDKKSQRSVGSTIRTPEKTRSSNIKENIDEDGDLENLKSCLKIGSISKSKLKKKSSPELVKDKKSQRSLGRTPEKTRASNTKESKFESSESSSAKYVSSDSSHSEVVRHLEKVLHSSKPGPKNARFEKRSNHLFNYV